MFDEAIDLLDQLRLREVGFATPGWFLLLHAWHYLKAQRGDGRVPKYIEFKVPRLLGEYSK